MRILVVEDDPLINAQVVDALKFAQYEVESVVDGEEALFLGENEAYAAIILDIGLPKIDGLSVLRKWREQKINVPVILLTARDTWSEKVDGIDAGADDYITKPFYNEELLARLRAILRRVAGQSTNDLTFGPLSINTRSGKVTLGKNQIRLTAHEYKILQFLASRPGVIVSRTELIEQIYNQDWDRDSNTIEVFIGRLRRKLGIDLIHTVRGLGYQLSYNEADEEGEASPS